MSLDDIGKAILSYTRLSLICYGDMVLEMRVVPMGACIASSVVALVLGHMVEKWWGDSQRRR